MESAGWVVGDGLALLTVLREGQAWRVLVVKRRLGLIFPRSLHGRRSALSLDIRCIDLEIHAETLRRRTT